MVTSILEALSGQEQYRRRLAQIQRGLDDLTDATVRDTFGLLGEIRRDAVAALASVPQDGGTWPAYRLTSLIAALDGAAKELTERVGGRLKDGTRRAWDDGATAQFRALRLTAPVLTAIGFDSLLIAQQLQADLVRKVSLDFRQRAAREVTIAVAGAQSPWEATRKVGDLLRTQPAREDRRLGTIANQAERIVRTEVMGAFNLADRARDDELAVLVPSIRKWWDAAGDGRTRPTHAAAESRYAPGAGEGPIELAADFRVGGERASGPHDPRLSAAERVNCRCIRGLWSPDWT